MIAFMGPDDSGPSATDGEIAAINLESARRGGWARFAQDPGLPGVAEEIVDSERLVLQFLGNTDVLDRLDALALQFAHADDSSRVPLVQAEVGSTAHRFDDARRRWVHLRLQRGVTIGRQRSVGERGQLGDLLTAGLVGSTASHRHVTAQANSNGRAPISRKTPFRRKLFPRE